MIRVAAILFSLAFLLSGCVGINQRRPPSLTLEIPPAFDNSTKIKRFNRGDYLYKNPPYWKKANCPITKIYGLWKQWENQSKDHSWSIQISLTTNEKVLSALNQAKDGYDAKKVDDAGSYMFARFERKSFRWGRAFSYLTQFTQDTAYYVPNNGHLEYEIWGVTDDLKHVIHADFSITHPKLANWGSSVRITRSIEVLKKDRDYKRVESCNPAAFSPSLKSIDALVGSLRIK